MKRIITIVAMSLIAMFGFNNSTLAQVERGNAIIDPYYGFPNFGKSFIDLVVQDNNIQGLQNTGIGPCGVRGEFMLSDNFGVGIDFIYNNAAINGTIDSLNADSTIFRTYNAKIQASRYRVHLRVNYHFVQTDQLDAYVGLGAGTNLRQLTVNSDYPGFDKSSWTGAIIPVSARLAIGCRYYFTNNIGFNLELGAGGPMISGGVSIKI